MFALRDLWQGIGDFKIFVKYRDNLYAYFSIWMVICKIYQQKSTFFKVLSVFTVHLPVLPR